MDGGGKNANYQTPPTMNYGLNQTYVVNTGGQRPPVQNQANLGAQPNVLGAFLLMHKHTRMYKSSLPF